MRPTLNNSLSGKARRSVIVVENFYHDPAGIRDYALNQDFYTPYEDWQDVKSGVKPVTWWASRFKSYEDCPFKSSPPLVKALEDSVGEKIDLRHWRASFGLDDMSRPLKGGQAGQTCLWNCCFHVKPLTNQKLGDGVHNHVVDNWNSVGPNGWTGLIYLNPNAPIGGGLTLWRNRNTARQFDWMTPAENWELVDIFGNVFNRLILVRGDLPHSGSDGWGKRIEEGRMYQTFFFRTISGSKGAIGKMQTAKSI